MQCFTETGLECLMVEYQLQSMNHGLTSTCDLQVALTYFLQLWAGDDAKTLASLHWCRIKSWGQNCG